MKKALFVLIIVLTLSFALTTAPADEPLSLRDFVEQVLVTMAKANDYEWRIVQEFSNEELGALIEACEANGITLPEDSYLMKHYRDGETYYEESAISVVCEAVFGVDFWEWRIADRQWLREVMEGLGYDDWEQEEVPGPDDLTEDEARTILFAALHENYGDDIPFENSEYFRITLSFEPDQEWDEDGTRWEDGWSWELDCRRREDGQQFLAHMDHAGQNVVTFMLKNNSLLKNESYSTGETSLEEYSLTEEEAIHLAAEAIRDQTGVDAPLEDPEFYQASARELTATADGTLYWDVFFPSCSKEWGYCRATVEDVSRVVRVKTTDVGPTTVDNILDRYQNEYGFWGYWPLETWVQLSEEKEGLPAVSFEARILGNTRYILPREGLLSQLEADEIAFRTAGLTRASIYCMVLIDADPHPVWKFCLEKDEGVYALAWTIIEVDAVTGEVLYTSPWYHDVDKSYRLYTLHDWVKRLTIE